MTPTKDIVEQQRKKSGKFVRSQKVKLVWYDMTCKNWAHLKFLSYKLPPSSSLIPGYWFVDWATIWFHYHNSLSNNMNNKFMWPLYKLRQCFLSNSLYYRTSSKHWIICFIYIKMINNSVKNLFSKHSIEKRTIKYWKKETLRNNFYYKSKSYFGSW